MQMSVLFKQETIDSAAFGACFNDDGTEYWLQRAPLVHLALMKLSM